MTPLNTNACLLSHEERSTNISPGAVLVLETGRSVTAFAQDLLRRREVPALCDLSGSVPLMPGALGGMIGLRPSISGRISLCERGLANAPAQRVGASHNPTVNETSSGPVPRASGRGPSIHPDWLEARGEGKPARFGPTKIPTYPFPRLIKVPPPWSEEAAPA